MTIPEQSIQIVSSSATDVGCVRTLNEDALLDRPDIGLWAVADGMGGHESGDFASRTIIDALRRVDRAADPAEFLRDVQARIHEAHDAMRREIERRGNGKTIGSTVVALIVSNRHFACVWAGDSRLYLLRDGALRQVTRDHSLVQDLVDAGQLDAALAESHPQANIITRAVGATEELTLDKHHDGLQPGDHLILCSDGLTRYVTDDEIAQIVRGTAIGDAAKTLVEAALEHYTRDNVTVVAVALKTAPVAEEDLDDSIPRFERATLIEAGVDSPAQDGDSGQSSSHGPTTIKSADPEDVLSMVLADGPADPPSLPMNVNPDDPLAVILSDGPLDRVSGVGLNRGDAMAGDAGSGGADTERQGAKARGWGRLLARFRPGGRARKD